jgi:imidazole glycerol-phosphate synthase subunit HisF
MKDRLRLMEKRDVDELIILDIDATPNKHGPRFEEVSELCDNLFCPVTIGGGVRNEQDIRRLLRSGADKCAICTRASDEPGFIEQAARGFGSQCIVVAIDTKDSRVFVDCGSRDTGRRPVEWAREVESRGAGEILLSSVVRDGTLKGYDLETIQEISEAVEIPVIANGGCGSYEHIVEALEAGAHACAVGAAFQFLELTPKGASRYLNDRGYNVRL